MTLKENRMSLSQNVGILIRYLYIYIYVKHYVIGTLGIMKTYYVI